MESNYNFIKIFILLSFGVHIVFPSEKKSTQVDFFNFDPLSNAKDLSTKEEQLLKAMQKRTLEVEEQALAYADPVKKDQIYYKKSLSQMTFIGETPISDDDFFGDFSLKEDIKNAIEFVDERRREMNNKSQLMREIQSEDFEQDENFDDL